MYETLAEKDSDDNFAHRLTTKLIFDHSVSTVPIVGHRKTTNGI
jgi:hypothetical protein